MGVRVHHLVSNFTAGELSPRLEARIDVAKYNNGCHTLENFTVHPQGGASGRYGTQFITEVKDSTQSTRLIRFRFSATQAYILEFGNLYLRVYKDRGRIESPPGTPVEVVTPYAAADVAKIHVTQSADVLFLTCPGYPQQKLSRRSHTDWTLAPMTFNPPATDEEKLTPADTLTITTGTHWTTAAFQFLAGDVGRNVYTNDGGQGVITAIDGGGLGVTVQVITAPVAGSFLTTLWWMLGSPNAGYLWCAVNPIPLSSVQTFKAISAMGVGPPTVNTFRAADVGKYLTAMGGEVLIASFVSASEITAQIITPLTGWATGTGAGAQLTQCAAPGSWRMEVPQWTALLGYPTDCTIVDGRLLFGRDTNWWGSSVTDIQGFAKGSTDDTAYAFKLGNGEMDAICWIRQSRSLLLGTSGAEYAAISPGDNPITASNPPTIRPAGTVGSGSVAPLRVGNDIIFLSASGKRVVSLSYAFASDSFAPKGLLLLAQHLTENLAHSIQWMTYQAEPDGILWYGRSDGTLLGCTYLPDQDVLAWHRHPTDGQVLWGETIPATSRTHDELWLIVKRQIGGVWKQYIEVMVQDFDMYAGVAPGMRVDCGLTYSGAPATVFSGLGHLEGKTVKIVGNGAVCPDEVVIGGSVTIEEPAVTIAEIGLGFTPTLIPMRPEVPVAGTSQGVKKAWGPVTVRLKDSLGVTINGDQMPFRTSADPMGKPPALFTGDKTASQSGWGSDAYLTVQQTQPLPITVLGIFGVLTVGD